MDKLRNIANPAGVPRLYAVTLEHYAQYSVASNFVQTDTKAYPELSEAVRSVWPSTSDGSEYHLVAPDGVVWNYYWDDGMVQIGLDKPGTIVLAKERRRDADRRQGGERRGATCQP